MGEGIEIYFQLREQVYQCIYSSFGLKKLIEHNNLLLLQNAIAALKRTALVAYNVVAFFNDPLNLI